MTMKTVWIDKVTHIEYEPSNYEIYEEEGWLLGFIKTLIILFV